MPSIVAESHLIAAIRQARGTTDSLFAQVRPEAWLDRPIPERHRALFYIGHLEAFDWNQVGRAALAQGPVSAELDALFAFGIDPPVGQLPTDQPRDWPTIEETRHYATLARQRVDSVIAEAPEEVLQMVFEHRLMHAETFSYMLHNLPYSRRVLAAPAPSASGESPHLRMVEIPAGALTLGRQRGGGFGWDNEFGEHTRTVGGFAVSQHKITNGQYLEFVNAGGPVPHYWTLRQGGWLYRGFLEERPLPRDWPVYVSQAQAQAYASFIGKALPSEAQFHRAAFGTPQGTTREHPWGGDRPRPSHGNFDFSHSDLVAVTGTPEGDSAFGVSQLVGNGWEWTSSPFEPFPGFEPIPSYQGYSAPFFDGDHFVVKGASCATPAALLRSAFRNWFRRDYPYAYVTFRVVDN